MVGLPMVTYWLVPLNDRQPGSEIVMPIGEAAEKMGLFSQVPVMPLPEESLLTPPDVSSSFQ